MSKQFTHEDFSCIATRCWHAPMSKLRRGRFEALFDDFCRRFPDHPSHVNTHIYLEFNGDEDLSPPSWSMSWACSHFEHTGHYDVARLVEFMNGLADLAQKPQFASLHVEKLQEPYLHLKLYDPSEDVRSEIFQVADELAEWQPPQSRPDKVRK